MGPRDDRVADPFELQTRNARKVGLDCIREGRLVVAHRRDVDDLCCQSEKVRNLLLAGVRWRHRVL
jgi:hypothetical protein